MLTRKAGGESWAAFRSACEKTALLEMCGEGKQGKGNAEPFRSGMFSFGLRDCDRAPKAEDEAIDELHQFKLNHGLL